jgi:hypothetical protein
MSRFKKPTVEEIAAYVAEHKYNVSPEAFFAYYESNGWHVGKQKMKSWQAAVRYWQFRRSKMMTGRRVPIAKDPGFDPRF